MAAPHKSPKSVAILLAIGAMMIIGSLPMFLIRKPFMVFHQSYKYVPSRGEMITPESGIFYGLLFLVIGSIFIWLYFRVRGALRKDGENR